MARILVVDDETSMQEFLEILLRREGHDVVVCGSADEAVVALESDDFDLVLSDIQMPGMTGLELLDHVKDASPETLLVLITAYGTAESAVEAQPLDITIAGLTLTGPQEGFWGPNLIREVTSADYLDVLAEVLSDHLAYPRGVDAGIDDQVRDMNVFGTKFPSHALR